MKLYEKISLAIFTAASISVLCAGAAMTTLHCNVTFTFSFGSQQTNPLTMVLPASTLRPPRGTILAAVRHG